MVTTPEEPESPVGRVTIVRRQAETGARLVIAGHEVGAVRRIVLYAVTGVALLMAGDPLAALGLVALFLLGLTDDLR